MNCAPMEEVVCETNQAAMLFRNKSVNRFFRIEEAFPCGVRDFRSESRRSFPAIERVIAGPKRFPCRAVSGFDAAYSDGRRHLALFVFWRSRKRSSTTAGGGELCFTLNYHLSTLNFLSTTASGWLQRFVRWFGWLHNWLFSVTSFFATVSVLA